MMSKSSKPSPSAPAVGAPAVGAPPSDNVPIWSVSEIAAAVRQRIKDGFQRVRVRGELGRVTQPQSGHLYVDIKDDHAVLAGVMWRDVAQRLRLKPEAGMEVVCSGRLDAYAPQSRYQLVIEEMELAGAGALMAQLETRRRQFAAEGLFAAERKQALPFLPDLIGVITSPSGAVIRDIAQRIGARFPRRLVVWPVRVQGESCAAEVARAIEGFNAKRGAARPDVLIVARGGGSLEDLWGFNDEAVVRAAAASKIPLVSAIGHETDRVLLDEAADERAATPSAAAERVVPVRAQLLDQTESFALRLRRAARRFLAHKQTALTAAVRGLVSPHEILLARAQRLDELSARARRSLAQHARGLRARYDVLAARAPLRLLAAQLDRAAARFGGAARRFQRTLAHALEARTQRLSELQRALNLLGHESVLQRGFALVFTDSERLVRAAADAPAGTRLRVQLAQDDQLAARSEGALRIGEGALRTTVPRTRKVIASAPVSAVNSRRRRRPQTAAGQSDLFMREERDGSRDESQ